MKNEEIPLSPIAGWNVAPISAYEAVMLRLDYLTHATQRPEEAQQTPQLVMTAAQALELSETLRKHAALAIQGTPGAGLPKH
jgi:biofilm regulator BssS